MRRFTGFLRKFSLYVGAVAALLLTLMTDITAGICIGGLIALAGLGLAWVLDAVG